MSKYSHILFDADNTLFDFDKCEREAFRGAVEDSGIVFSDEVYSDYHVINDGLWKLLEKGGIDRATLKSERYRRLYEKYGITGEVYVEVSKKYERLLGEQTFEIDGVFEMLTRLSSRYSIYVITNGLTSVQESRFSKSRLTCFIKNVFISEKVGYAKPDPLYFDYVFSQIGCSDRSKYIVIGDSLTSDIDGAIKYGIDCIWYNRNSGDSDGRHPTYTVSDITDVERIL